MECDQESKTECISVEKRCEVCLSEPWKYRCPGCALVTCCLACVKQHKLESSCTGQRDKTAFLAMSEFDERHMLNDYRYLEEVDRLADNSRRHKPRQWPTLSNKCCALKRRAQKFCGIQLHFLPDVFTKHKNNTTLCRNDGRFEWTIDWSFPDSSSSFVTHKNQDCRKISEAFDQFLQSPECPSSVRARHRLQESKAEFLIKLENVQGVKYERIKPDDSIRSVLTGRMLIEYPTIKVVYETESGSKSEREREKGKSENRSESEGESSQSETSDSGENESEQSESEMVKNYESHRLMAESDQNRKVETDGCENESEDEVVYGSDAALMDY